MQIATTLAFVGSQFKLTEEAQKLADVWIEPDLHKFNLLDYHKYKQVAEEGYAEAKATIREWKSQLASSPDPPPWLQKECEHAQQMESELSVPLLCHAGGSVDEVTNKLPAAQDWKDH